MEIYSLDIGGSSIKRGVVTVKEGRAELATRIPNISLKSKAFSEVREAVVSSIAAHVKETSRKVDVAISTTGSVARSGIVLSAGHFDDYAGIDWKEILESLLPKKVSSVVTVNDGKASTWAEYNRVGRGSQVFVHFVVGTGVGGGIVCFDRLLFGDDETAGALGHMKVGGDDAVACSCGQRGCLETLASGPAIARAFHRLRGNGELTSDGPTVNDAFLAARRGDSRALQAFDIAGQWLGIGISNVINVLNPRHITVGGGVVEASTELDPAGGGPYLRSAILRANESAFEDVAAATIIEPASTGNDGGLLGAALFSASSNRG